MKIAVISDLHDNISNLEKCLRWCSENEIESLLCCGDIANDDTVAYLTEGFPKPIYMVRGNMDYFDTQKLDKYKNLIYCGRIGRIELGGQWIGLCHEPFLFDQVIAEGNCSIVFYGHTHKPWEEDKNGVRFANPGTLAGMFQMATFAVYDTMEKELVLQILDRL